MEKPKRKKYSNAEKKVYYMSLGYSMAKHCQGNEFVNSMNLGGEKEYQSYRHGYLKGLELSQKVKKNRTDYMM